MFFFISIIDETLYHVVIYIVELISKGKHGKSYTSILLRKSARTGSKVKSKTLAVLTHLSPHVLAAVRRTIAQQLGIKQALDVTDQAALSYWQGVWPGCCAPASHYWAWFGWPAVVQLQHCWDGTEDDLYANGTWLEGRYELIERRLFGRLDRHVPKSNYFSTM